MSTTGKKTKTPSKTKYLFLLSGDNQTSTCITSKNKDTSYEHLAKIFPNNFETLYRSPKYDIYVDEIGLIANLPQNEAAAYLLEHLGVYWTIMKTIGWIGLVYGPMVVVTKDTSVKDTITTWMEKYKSDPDSIVPKDADEESDE